MNRAQINKLMRVLVFIALSFINFLVGYNIGVYTSSPLANKVVNQVPQEDTLTSGVIKGTVAYPEANKYYVIVEGKIKDKTVQEQWRVSKKHYESVVLCTPIDKNEIKGAGY